MSNTKFPRCHETHNCFALTNDGRCSILSDTRFKKGYCPFFKTPEEAHASTERAMRRLTMMSVGAALIAKYNVPVEEVAE